MVGMSKKRKKSSELVDQFLNILQGVEKDELVDWITVWGERDPGFVDAFVVHFGPKMEAIDTERFARMIRRDVILSHEGSEAAEHYLQSVY